MIEAVWIVVVALVVINLIATIFVRGGKKDQAVVLPAPPQVNVNLKPLQDAMEGLPNKVLQSITSSSSVHKGKLGELIGYLQLHASYDRVIPLADIMDFLVINFPTDKDPGRITFIDVKTGKSARLSRDQKIVKQLIEEKRVEFIKLSISEPRDNT